MPEAQDPLDDDQDPAADTPGEPAEDTAEATDEAADEEYDPKSRAEATRKVSEQGKEIARLKHQLELAGQSDEDDPDEPEGDGDDDGEPDAAYTAKHQRESLALAESLYGREAVEMYHKVFQVAARNATTDADAVGALEAYHQARLNGGKPPDQAEAGAKPAAKSNGDERLTPRTDSNRSDSTPDSEAIKQAEAGKSLEQVVKGRLDRFFGG